MNKTYLLALAALLLLPPATFAMPPPKNECEDPADWFRHTYWVPATGLLALNPPVIRDSNIVEDCDGDTIPADYDGHSDFALGSAWLPADSGDGVTGGSLVCYGEPAHHPVFGPFTVTDFVFGAGTTTFTVASDTLNEVPPTDPAAPNCGDFTTDNHTTCIGTCSVTFQPGLDGLYIVYVGDILNQGVATGGYVDS